MKRNRTAAVALVLGGALAGAAQPDASAGLLAQLSAGRWQVHEIGAKQPPRDVCIAVPAQLVHVHHAGQQCARTPISASGRTATFHYSCAAAGGGQTVLTIENPALVRIQTQGIARGQPFDLDLEARRVGGC